MRQGNQLLAILDQTVHNFQQRLIALIPIVLNLLTIEISH